MAPLSICGASSTGGPDDHWNLAAEQRGDGERIAAIGNVHHLDAGRGFQQLAGQMVGAAEIQPKRN